MINSIGLLMNKLSPPKSLFSPRGYTLSVAHLRLLFAFVRFLNLVANALPKV